jgi:transposase-like protein
MAESGQKFAGKKEKAILALLTSRSVEEAARTANVPPRTLYRWMKEPGFDAEYRAARRAAYGQAVARLQQGTSAAATTLLKTMIDPSTPASAKIRAAEAIFNHAAKALEIEDLEARVVELERSNRSSGDFANTRELIISALEGQPDEVKAAIARKLLEMGRAESSANGHWALR